MNQSPVTSRVCTQLSPFVLGQICSVLLAICSLASNRLGQLSFFAPALQNAIAYFFLAFHLIPFVLRKRQALKSDVEIPWLSRRIHEYMSLSVFDFFANFCVIFAFSLTSMTSAQILAGCTVPFVVCFRWMFLKSRITGVQAGAVTVGVFGLALIIYEDSKSSLDSQRHIWGDLLALVAALLYASCNCLEEFLLKLSQGEQSPEWEMLGMLGVCGVVLGLGVAGVSGELETVREVKEWDKTVGWLGVYVSSLLGFYKLLGLFMRKYDAALFNLSILSTGVYVGLMDGVKGGWMYWLGVALLWGGCGWYHWKDASH